MAFLVFPASLFVDILLTGSVASTKYYFFGTVASSVVFLTTGIHFYRHASVKVSGEKLRMLHSVYMELVRGAMWAIALTILGTTFSQIEVQSALTSGEMILIFFTFGWIVLFVAIPTIQSIFSLIEQAPD